MDIIYQVALIPAITGFIEMLKKVGLPDKYAPIVSQILGILAGIFYIAPGDIKKGVLLGVTFGLSASGFYSIARNVEKSNTTPPSI